MWLLFHVVDYLYWRKLGDRLKRCIAPCFCEGLNSQILRPQSLPYVCIRNLIPPETYPMRFWSTCIPDKHFATFFGRPPMISGRFYLGKMSLDLENNQLALNAEALVHASNDYSKDYFESRKNTIFVLRLGEKAHGRWGLLPSLQTRRISSKTQIFWRWHRLSDYGYHRLSSLLFHDLCYLAYSRWQGIAIGKNGTLLMHRG